MHASRRPHLPVAAESTAGVDPVAERTASGDRRGAALTEAIDAPPGVAADRAGTGCLGEVGDHAASSITDEEAASAARRRFRSAGFDRLEPDGRIAPMLETGEEVLAVRRCVSLDRREPARDDPRGGSLEGDLYLTSRRLIHLGRIGLTFELDEIEDAILVGESVFFLMQDGAGVIVDTDRPRLLRVEVAAARSSRRSRR